MNRYFKFIILTTFFFSNSNFLVGQEAYCLGFEEFEAGVRYGIAAENQPGDTIFTQANIPISLAEFLHFNGETSFRNVDVTNDIFGENFEFGEGNYLFPSNINLVFDFSDLPEQVVQVCFDYYDGGGEENIAVNGLPIKVVNNLEEAISEEFAPGIALSIEEVIRNDFELVGGKLCLTGPIDSLLIGGQEWVIDNVCYVTENPLPDCAIYDIIAEPSPCTPNGVFFVDLAFSSINTGNQGYSVKGNGNDYGDFSYEEEFITLGPFSPDENEVLEFVIIDDENPECQNFIELGPISCESPCSISNVIAEAHDCEDGTFLIDIEISSENPGRLGYYIFADGEINGPFSYEERFVTIGPFPGDGENIYDILVLDIETPSCFGYVELGPIDCDNTNECAIIDLALDPQECQEDGSYDLIVKFEHENANNDFFDVYIGDEFIGFYALDDLPIRLERLSFRNPNNFGVLTVCINDNPNCCSRKEFRIPDCENNGGDCRIYDVIAEAHPCNDDGGFLVDIAFEFENVGSSGFYVKGNGREYGAFSYDQEFVTVGPIRGDGETVYEFVIIDKDNPNCTNYTTLGPISCDSQGECAISNIRVDPLECDGEGTYSLKLDFDFQNVQGVGFDVFTNQGFFGFYSYEDLPIRLNNFPERPNLEYDFIKICENDNPNCCKEFEFMGPNCGANGGDCRIYDVIAEAHPCNDDGGFLVDIAFEFENVSSSGFYIKGNGREYGAFSYEQEFVTVGPIRGDGETVYEFVIIDKENEECWAEVTIGPINCREELLVWPGDANTDNIANNIDLLNIGLAYGAEGPVRDEEDLEWEGKEAPNWDQAFINVNYKHADCNGDGVISVADRDAIKVNYNLTHGPVRDPEPLPNTDTDPPIFVDLPEAGELTGGSSFEVPIILGSADRPINDIYGLAFTINFDVNLIDPSSLSIQYPTSWFGQENVNLITLDTVLKQEGKIEIGMTRIDQNEVSGFGRIALLRGIIDNIAGYADSDLLLDHVVAITIEQRIIPLFTPTIPLKIIPPKEDNVGRIDLLRNTLVYPNPVTDFIHINNKYGLLPQEIEVIDAKGKSVLGKFYEAETISTGSLPAGVYMLKMVIGEHTIVKRFIKQ